MNTAYRILMVGLGTAVAVISIIFTWFILVRLGLMGLENLFGDFSLMGERFVGFFIFIISAASTIIGAVAYYEHITPPLPPLSPEEKRQRDIEMEIEDAARYGY